jgi:competence ComEA-like helix-hairpin-helix protein
MKDKKTFRLISIGFLSGIAFSGMVFLTINSILVHQSQKSIYANTPSAFTEALPGTVNPTGERININQATFTQLVSLPGIGEAKASAIIDFREKYGDFEDISELNYVAGIGNTLYKSLEDLVIIN